jgi:predicted MPP superfamily phosphohydrolase
MNHVLAVDVSPVPWERDTRSGMVRVLTWLVIVPLALVAPTTTFFRSSTLWTCLNFASFAALGCYLCWSYSHPFRLGRRAQWLAYGGAVLVGGLSLAARGSVRHAGLVAGWPPVQVLAWLTYAPASLMLCLLPVAVVKDLVTLCLSSWLSRQDPRARWARRSVVVSWCCAIGLLFHATHEAARVPRVVTVDVPVVGLPAELEGLRIAQLSDLHVGQTVGEGFARRVVAEVEQLNADMIVITGDLVDHRPTTTVHQLGALRQLCTGHQVYFVTGNHEHGWGAGGWVRELRAMGVDVLQNESRVVTVRGGSLTLLGVVDASARYRRDGIVTDLAAAASSAPAAGPRILLSHQAPRRLMDQARALGVDLVISGHTHGGQVYPGHLLAAAMQPWLAGLHRCGPMWIYVSRGAGFWGPMLRIGAPSEIAVLRLKAATAVVHF